MPRTLAAAVAVLVFAALPAVADAKTYKGKTNQGKTATVRTGANGVVSRARLVWSARCGHNRRFRDATTFKAPLDAATADMVQDAGTYRVKDAAGYIGRITMTLAGQRNTSTDRWAGTLAVKVQVSRHGKVVDQCSASKLTWHAK